MFYFHTAISSLYPEHGPRRDSMNNYKLVFDGTISDGYQIQDVKKNLTALLKAKESQIELLFLETRGGH